MKSPSLRDASANESASLDWLLHDPGFLGLPKLKIRSRAEILGLSGMIAVLVFLAALGLQWIIYDRSCTRMAFASSAPRLRQSWQRS
jgi:hypothetical protein